MAMPRPSPSEYLPDVNACCAAVVIALSALVEQPQADAVETLVRAAMADFNEKFTHFRWASLENKLRKNNSRLQHERDKNLSLKQSMRDSKQSTPKKKIPADFPAPRVL
jgi:hypothetical protein